MGLTGSQNKLEAELIYICVAQVASGFHTVLLFSSCLEWRYTYPLLEEAGYETWAIDILGWGFSDLGSLYYFTYIFYLYFFPSFFSVLKIAVVLFFTSYLSIRKTPIMWCGIEARSLLSGTIMCWSIYLLKFVLCYETLTANWQLLQCECDNIMKCYIIPKIPVLIFFYISLIQVLSMWFEMFDLVRL